MCWIVYLERYCIDRSSFAAVRYVSSSTERWSFREKKITRFGSWKRLTERWSFSPEMTENFFRFFRSKLHRYAMCDDVRTYGKKFRLKSFKQHDFALLWWFQVQNWVYAADWTATVQDARTFAYLWSKISIDAISLRYQHNSRVYHVYDAMIICYSVANESIHMLMYELCGNWHYAKMSVTVTRVS
jgi:hypothetical protein